MNYHRKVDEIKLIIIIYLRRGKLADSLQVSMDLGSIGFYKQTILRHMHQLRQLDMKRISVSVAR